MMVWATGFEPTETNEVARSPVSTLARHSPVDKRSQRENLDRAATAVTPRRDGDYSASTFPSMIHCGIASVASSVNL